MEEFLEQVGTFAGNESMARGALVCGGAALAALGGAWSLLRKKKVDRVRVNVDAPLGQVVEVKVGERREP